MNIYQNTAWVLAIVALGLCATTPLGDQVTDRLMGFVNKYRKLADRISIPAVILLLALALWHLFVSAAANGKI